MGDILLWHAISRSQLLRSDICCCSTGRWSVLNAVHGFLQCLNLTHCCKNYKLLNSQAFESIFLLLSQPSFFWSNYHLSFLFLLKWPSFKYLCPILITSPLRPPLYRRLVIFFLPVIGSHNITFVIVFNNHYYHRKLKSKQTFITESKARNSSLLPERSWKCNEEMLGC